MFNVFVPFPKNAGNCNRVWIIGFIRCLAIRFEIVYFDFVLRNASIQLQTGQEFFLKEGSKVEYSGLAATFVGQIYHDLLTCETGKENSMVKTKVSKLKKFLAKCTKKNLIFFFKIVFAYNGKKHTQKN